MTTAEIRELVLSADASASRYESASQHGESYTVWQETRRLGLTADDRHEEAWGFQIDRYTKDEYDPVAEALFEALDADPRVAFEHIVTDDPGTRYIHHIFDCEGY